MKRKGILDQAIQCICTDGQGQYGSPENNFNTIANLWSDYLFAKYGFEMITPTDVGVLMALLKIGRMASGQIKADNYVDACGYLACTGEIATTQDVAKGKIDDIISETVKAEDYD